MVPRSLASDASTSSLTAAVRRSYAAFSRSLRSRAVVSGSRHGHDPPCRGVGAFLGWKSRPPGLRPDCPSGSVTVPRAGTEVEGAEGGAPPTAKAAATGRAPAPPTEHIAPYASLSGESASPKGLGPDLSGRPWPATSTPATRPSSPSRSDVARPSVPGTPSCGPAWFRAAQGRTDLRLAARPTIGGALVARELIETVISWTRSRVRLQGAPATSYGRLALFRHAGIRTLYGRMRRRLWSDVTVVNFVLAVDEPRTRISCACQGSRWRSTRRARTSRRSSRRRPAATRC
jgi:hypothetical protein